MKTLALDFSTDQRAVALVIDDAVVAQAQESGGQQTQAFAMIERVLSDGGISREAVDLLALGLGPGSYAGIRVALSIAMGWQLATGINTTGISTVQILAWTAHQGGHRGELDLIIDAQRGEFYLGRYLLEDAACHELAPLEIATREKIESRLSKGVIVMGPQARKAFAQTRDLYPDAGVLGRLAARDGKRAPAEQLEPIYLRPVSFVKAPPARTDL